MEPDWDEVRKTMESLTLRRIAPIRQALRGSLGGASAKADVIDAVITQLRHWWRHGGEHGRARCRRALVVLERAARTEDE